MQTSTDSPRWQWIPMSHLRLRAVSNTNALMSVRSSEVRTSPAWATIYPSAIPGWAQSSQAREKAVSANSSALCIARLSPFRNPCPLQKIGCLRLTHCFPLRRIFTPIRGGCSTTYTAEDACKHARSATAQTFKHAWTIAEPNRSFETLLPYANLVGAEYFS